MSNGKRRYVQNPRIMSKTLTKHVCTLCGRGIPYFKAKLPFHHQPSEINISRHTHCLEFGLSTIVAQEFGPTRAEEEE